jgi:hypothetical protein
MLIKGLNFFRFENEKQIIHLHGFKTGNIPFGRANV